MKECQQLLLSIPTPCFIKAGKLPCSDPDCLIQLKDAEYRKERRVLPTDLRELFFHSTCRMSSLSPDNEEFKKRVGRTY